MSLHVPIVDWHDALAVLTHSKNVKCLDRKRGYRFVPVPSRGNTFIFTSCAKETRQSTPLAFTFTSFNALLCHFLPLTFSTLLAPTCPYLPLLAPHLHVPIYDWRHTYVCVLCPFTENVGHDANLHTRTLPLHRRCGARGATPLPHILAPSPSPKV